MGEEGEEEGREEAEEDEKEEEGQEAEEEEKEEEKEEEGSLPGRQAQEGPAREQGFGRGWQEECGEAEGCGQGPLQGSHVQPALTAITGKSKMTCPAIVKAVWGYIKSKKLNNK